MQTANIKEAVHELADKLSHAATWDEMTVRKEIEQGMADSRAGRVTPVDNILKKFGIAW